MTNAKLQYYLITDDKYLKNKRKFFWIIKTALKNGITAVEYRIRTTKSHKKIIKIGNKIKKLSHKYNALFLVNNHVDLALDLNADGIHVGQNDLSINAVRAKFKGLIGITVHDVEQAKKAQNLHADFITVGSIYKSHTKKNHPIISLSMLKQIRSIINIPIIATGGLNYGNISTIKPYVNGLGLCGLIFDYGAHPENTMPVIKKKFSYS